jgi:hypothetical protein
MILKALFNCPNGGLRAVMRFGFAQNSFEVNLNGGLQNVANGVAKSDKAYRASQQIPYKLLI